jgi:hypothetical protein
MFERWLQESLRTRAAGALAGRAGARALEAWRSAIAKSYSVGKPETSWNLECDAGRNPQDAKRVAKYLDRRERHAWEHCETETTKTRKFMIAIHSNLRYP